MYHLSFFQFLFNQLSFPELPQNGTFEGNFCTLDVAPVTQLTASKQWTYIKHIIWSKSRTFNIM